MNLSFLNSFRFVCPLFVLMHHRPNLLCKYAVVSDWHRTLSLRATLTYPRFNLFYRLFSFPYSWFETHPHSLTLTFRQLSRDLVAATREHTTPFWTKLSFSANVRRHTHSHTQAYKVQTTIQMKINGKISLWRKNRKLIVKKMQKKIVWNIHIRSSIK